MGRGTCITTLDDRYEDHDCKGFSALSHFYFTGWIIVCVRNSALRESQSPSHHTTHTHAHTHHNCGYHRHAALAGGAVQGQSDMRWIATREMDGSGTGTVGVGTGGLVWSRFWVGLSCPERAGIDGINQSIESTITDVRGIVLEWVAAEASHHHHYNRTNSED